MKKIIAIAAITILALSVIISDLNVNQHGIMITFSDSTGYWLEF